MGVRFRWRCGVFGTDSSCKEEWAADWGNQSNQKVRRFLLRPDLRGCSRQGFEEPADIFGVFMEKALIQAFRHILDFFDVVFVFIPVKLGCP